jgi:hypothetical protein
MTHKIQIDDEVRDATAEEIAAIEARDAEAAAKVNAKTEAEANKVSAQAKLSELGLSANDLKALGL